MRVSVSHNKPKEDVKRAVDRSYADLLRGTSQIPLQVTNQEKTWHGDALAFACTLRMGLISTGVRGTVYVTDTDVTIDADLGLLERLLSSKSVAQHLTGRVRGLLA